ncbi:protein FAR1-RELATED SEQUENCE 5-like [Lactuca sativa]|uniref:protein FAR1-RELATED SEQUENCE 5-like n=1 Tax=Lactuca sativa TaxID=4236 RepID=UPI000CD825D2|nr:protein FAR1-RELATED SEQUENCE 5-like [Lactuca sativa]
MDNEKTSNFLMENEIVNQIVHNQSIGMENEMQNEEFITHQQSAYQIDWSDNIDDENYVSDYVHHEENEEIGSIAEQFVVVSDYTSPGGTNYYTPKTNEDVKPKVNDIYDTYDAAVEMYKNYAFQAGFDITLGLNKKKTDGTFTSRLMCGLQGGCSVCGGLAIDYKNCARNLNCFIGGSDAQLILNIMEERVKYAPNFSFEFRVEEKRLFSMFWAYGTSKYNYKEFEDVVSFDVNYQTNRYNMVFVPFTGIDNHKRCVTFGARLLTREDTDSYKWLLKCFLKAFGSPPKIIMSDQDPTIKKAVDELLPLSSHRLCMWHITTKLPKKLTGEIAKNSDFKKRFNSLIWNAKINELEFEAGWDSMITEFHLEDNTWLRKMFGLRRLWIPAFFKNVPLFGLMRTTSLSESQNWSFQNTTLYGSYIVNFLMTFDLVMERQRHTQNSSDFTTTTTFPKNITYLPYEPHATKVYTRRIFYQVQEEIFESEKSCFIIKVVTNSSDGVDMFDVLERKKSVSTRTKEVVPDQPEEEEYHFDSLVKDKYFKVTHNKSE